jgi:hypothetical protein
MSFDLALGAVLLTIAAVLCFLAGAAVVRRASGPAVSIVFLIVVAALVGLLLFMQDRLIWARLFPFTGVIVLASFALPPIALLAGVLWVYLAKGKDGSRRGLVVGLLLVLGLVYTVKPFWGAPPPMHPETEEDGVVMQTSFSSCSAASAATLLRVHDIPATEEEMAQLCLTRRDGTSMLGVYRGLRKKTEGTPWRVDVLSGADVAALKQAAQDGPVLLSVGLDRFPAPDTDKRYAEQWGWTPGLRHAVVLFGFLPPRRGTTEDRLDIGDPSTGREKWSEGALGVLWRGEGIRLVRR